MKKKQCQIIFAYSLKFLLYQNELDEIKPNRFFSFLLRSFFCMLSFEGFDNFTQIMVMLFTLTI